MRPSEATRLQKRVVVPGKCGARFVAGRTVLNFDDVPVMEPLAPATPPDQQRPATTFVLANSFGLTQAEINTGRQAEFRRAELLAHAMLRTCRWCERRFLPDRCVCTCCSRPCYLKEYRKRQAQRYAGYTRRWRAKAKV